MAAPRRGLIRDNSLSLAFFAIFLVALLRQAIAGHRDHDAEQRDHGEPEISFVRYVTSSHFGVETAENRQSEFLQFALDIVADLAR